MEMTFVPLALLGAAILLLVIFFYYVPFLLWISAKVSGVNISLIQLFLMRIRNVPPYVITRAMIEAHKAGLKTLTRDELEAHYLAGGHVEKVVHALVSASKANIDLPFQMATAIDLAGRDVFEAVQMSVNPKVIDTPPVTAVAKDGIQLIAKARVTVRANIKQLVGGAGEETILARVGEGIVSSIGSSENHKSVLENPDSISKLVLRKGLDAGTAFEILSIDIADIDIGKNIGAYLQMDQAQADKNIAQAKAEERRAMAVAIERILYLSLSTINSKKLITKVEEALKNGGIEAAKEVCRNTRGPIASIYYQGLDRYDQGLDSVEKAVVSYGSVQTGQMESGLTWIGLFIALSPMLGFMGTVVGMIAAFDAIQAAGDISPTLVAGGIKVALLTTLMGLIAAVILQLFYNYIVSKIDSLVNDMEDSSITLMDILTAYSKK